MEQFSSSCEFGFRQNNFSLFFILVQRRRVLLLSCCCSSVVVVYCSQVSHLARLARLSRAIGSSVAGAVLVGWSTEGEATTIHLGDVYFTRGASANRRRRRIIFSSHLINEEARTAQS